MHLVVNSNAVPGNGANLSDLVRMMVKLEVLQWLARVLSAVPPLLSY